MDILSKTPSLPSTSITLSDVTDAVTALPFDKVGSALDSVTPALDDVSDLATVVAKTGSRIGLRTVRTSVRVVRRNPRFVAGAVAALIAATALAVFIRQRGETSETAPAS